HAGLLAKRADDDHRRALAEHEIAPIDLLVANLYPFELVVGRSEFGDEEAIENIDIGGPAMVRAAAKNHRDVIVLVNPSDYEPVLQAIEAGGPGAVDLDTRRALAAR